MTEAAKTKLRNWIVFEDKTAQEALDFTLEALGEQIEYGFTFTRDRAAFCVFQGGSGPAIWAGCLARGQKLQPSPNAMGRKNYRRRRWGQPSS